MRTVPGAAFLSSLNFSVGRVNKPPAFLGALLLGLTLTLGGCSVGSGGLPSGLPGVGAGGGALTITTAAIPDGVKGRMYTFSVRVQGGVAPYSCSLSNGTLSPGISVAAVGNTCLLSAPAGAIPGSANFNFTVQVTDSSAPFQVVSRSYAHFIRPEFSFAGLPASFPDGVQGRTYGAAGKVAPVGGTNVSGAVGNGPLTVCGVTGVGANASLTAALSGTTSCAVSSTSGLAASGGFPLVLTATDSPITDPANAANIVVPANTISAAGPVALTVQPVLTSTPNFVPVPDAVNGRTYGAPALANLTFTATGGIAGQTISVTAGVPPVGIVCTPAGAALNCNSGGAPVTGTTQTFTTTATDPGNSATPAGNVQVPATINVLPTITVSAFAIGNVTEQRAITTPVVVAATGGIQATLACSLAGSPAGLTAVAGAGTCTIAGTPNAGTAGNYAAFTLNATDAGNATTPPQVPPASATTPLLDNPVLLLNGGAALVLPQSTVNQPYTPFDIPFTGGNGPAASFVCTDVGGQLPANMTLTRVGSNCEIAGTPTSTVNRAITIRVADTASTSTAAGNNTQAGNLVINNGVTFTSTSPLPAGTRGRIFNFTLTAAGGTTFVAPPPYHFSPTGALTGTGVGDCAGLTLSIAGVISGTPTTFTNTPCVISLTVTDKIGATDTMSFTIPINDTLTLAAFALGNGVQGRPFNQLLPFTGGNAPYACAAPALPAPLVVAVNGLNCEITGTPGATFGPTLITVTVTDFPTGSTAAGNNAKAANLRIFAPLMITSTSPLLNGVIGRTYNFTFAATGGNGALTWSNPSGTLNLGSCTGLTMNAGGMLGGTSVGSAGTCTFDARVMDTASASTAAGTATLTPVNLNIHPELVITTTQAQIPNGLLNIPYPTAPITFAVGAMSGAQTPLTWTQAGSTGTLCPDPGGAMPPGISIAAATGVLSGTPTAASAVITDFTFGVCVEDAGNANVPGNFVLSAGAPASYVLNVMNTNAYIIAPGTPTVEVIDTTANSQTIQVLPLVPIPVTGFNNPLGVAISPDGRKAYVTFSGGATNAYMVIDTITNGVTTAQVNMPANCQAPTDIAVTPDNLRIYIVCPGGAVEEVAVFDATTDTLITEIPTGVGSSPKNLAIRADNARAYVTLNGLNELLTIDNSAATPVALGAPFALDATTDQPFGIVLAQSGATSTFAFISKQNAILPNTVQNIDVVDVTNDPPVNSNQIALTAAQVPVNLAAVPGDARIYFTLSSTNQFGVITNTGATSSLLAGSPFSAGAATNPVDIAIPELSPVPANGVLVYITRSSADDVAIFDNKAAPPPTANAASPIALTVGASPTRIKAIPVPK